ncbi:globin-like protein [Entophlyctis helioformis]|nr:globin-like protein [Entophlyctis helioformis]
MTLLDDIGGEEAVDTIVKVFYTNLVNDPRISPFFARTSMTRQRAMQTKFLVHIFGGKAYNGEAMRRAHKNLKLTDKHFDVVLEALTDALRTCGVCEAHIKQAAGLAEQTRVDILCRPPLPKDE